MLGWMSKAPAQRDDGINSGQHSPPVPWRALSIGWTILIVAGVLAIALSLLYAPPWRREARDTVVHHRDDPRY